LKGERDKISRWIREVNPAADEQSLNGNKKGVGPGNKSKRTEMDSLSRKRKKMANRTTLGEQRNVNPILHARHKDAGKLKPHIRQGGGGEQEEELSSMPRGTERKMKSQNGANDLRWGAQIPCWTDQFRS